MTRPNQGLSAGRRENLGTRLPQEVFTQGRGKVGRAVGKLVKTWKLVSLCTLSSSKLQMRVYYTEHTHMSAASDQSSVREQSVPL